MTFKNSFFDKKPAHFFKDPVFGFHFQNGITRGINHVFTKVHPHFLKQDWAFSDLKVLLRLLNIE